MIVHRVHWLRARAQRNRWSEELLLVQYEMEWTVNYFDYMAEVWNQRSASAQRDVHAGSAAYAHRQKAQWYSMAASARGTFEKIRSW